MTEKWQPKDMIGGDNGSRVGPYTPKQIIIKSYHGTIDTKNNKRKNMNNEDSAIRYIEDFFTK